MPELAAGAVRRTGGCLCGAVRFAVSGPLGPGIACHCSMCRKQTGLFYAATEIERAALAIEDEAAIAWYVSSARARRGFCGRCGSALFWADERADRISVMLGAFDGATGVAIGEHLFVADKGDYYAFEHNKAVV